jgi:hypothetical protein
VDFGRSPISGLKVAFRDLTQHLSLIRISTEVGRKITDNFASLFETLQMLLNLRIPSNFVTHNLVTTPPAKILTPLPGENDPEVAHCQDVDAQG